MLRIMAIALTVFVAWAHPAAAVDWTVLDEGWSYDRDSVKLGGSGGELIFRVRQEGVFIFHTACDDYAEWSQLTFTGAARALMFSKTRQKMKTGTMVAFLYGRICE